MVAPTELSEVRGMALAEGGASLVFLCSKTFVELCSEWLASGQRQTLHTRRGRGPKAQGQGLTRSTWSFTCSTWSRRSFSRLACTAQAEAGSRGAEGGAGRWRTEPA